MGKITGFLDYEKQTHGTRPVAERRQSFAEFRLPLDSASLQQQAARCMDCGIPYCHEGCPVNNIIPEFNDLIYRDDWHTALASLHATNNFPEFTGRVCPAPCEASCTLNLIDEPVSIKDIECAIIDHGWQQGWITPQKPQQQRQERIAIIGSGPAGLACAQQLARSGFHVHVFEKSASAGGLLRYGIPDFKMEKHLIDRRIDQMQAEGVVFHLNCHIGTSMTWSALRADHDAIVLACGAEMPRDLPLVGRNADGIHFAMDYLTQQNRTIRNEQHSDTPITAKDKHVIVIGGGDTGSDCIGTANRQKARSITQLEILGKPPEKEDKNSTWPYWPHKLRTSTSHQEGAERLWSVATNGFVTEDNRITALTIQEVRWQNGKPEPTNRTRTLPADLVLLAMGFLHTRHDQLIKESRVKLDAKGNILANDNDYTTSQTNVFACGDTRRGQSLVVWAIREGRECAQTIIKKFSQ
ncbi:MAG: glutamate synthase subunit beta [Alphaproteobacteria bacterium GM202ARS2]|nr:glutamate synthase subunit beta [Alphaproteobacteria bacterium GM202ARS2]